MFRFFSKSLMRRLIIQFLLGALIPILVVALFAFYYAGAALEEDAFSQLTTINKIEKEEIIRYLKASMDDVSILAKSRDVKKGFDLLKAYHDAGGGDPKGPYNVNSAEYKEIYKMIDPFFRKDVEVHGYYDIFLICKAHGHVMYTVAKEDDLGTNLEMGPYKDSGLGRLWAEVLKDKRTTMLDFSYYAPSREPAAFVGAPVFDENGEIYAVVAVQLSIKEIDSIMQERIGMGDTGESYLVGPDLLMRSDSRFEIESTILKKRIDTLAVRKAFEHKRGTEILEDYRGEEVLSAYSDVGLDERFGIDFDWAIISQIGADEAFDPVKALALRILWVGLAVAIVASLIGYLSARSIAWPLRNLSGLVARMADGDLTFTLSPENRSDEVGVLINAFHIMQGTLRDQTQQILEGANTIASSISHISATASELAASSLESSCSVTEITATVEEVKETSNISNEKAKQVAEDAEEIAQVSEKSKKASDSSISSINSIKEEMEYVAESIMKLSEQMQSIGEIINAVTDLADQSNLLSVNASIEAAKAGEYGKGFAVVAQEVKSVADQSKQATEQVRRILSDIQKATSAAVMATDRGSKAVEKGVDLAAQSGDTFQMLAENIMKSAQAATQIAVSSEQQLAGMDQLAQAMESINEVSRKNLDGARRLESATKSLQDLGQNLKELAGRFKV